MVDLGVGTRTSGFAVGFTSNDLFLTAELRPWSPRARARWSRSRRSSPVTSSRRLIKSGTEIPFQQAAASGATAVQFKEAVLALDVTPNITPDDRILLDLVINQDSVGDLVPSGQGGLIPAIDTTELTTQVLVGNGETVVLGGVFRTENLDSTSKVPFFGDIPYVGSVFRNESTQRDQDRDADLHHAADPRRHAARLRPARALWRSTAASFSSAPWGPARPPSASSSRAP
jgi:type IV pilus assembly protein PilQ